LVEREASGLSVPRYRRSLKKLNLVRAVAATTLLVSTVVIELMFDPQSRLTPLYLLCGTVFVAILVYAILDRFVGDRPLCAVVQVAGDTALVLGFVAATGGSASPLSFLFALPVMTAAALLGLSGGLMTATAAWILYSTLLARDSWMLAPHDLPPGRILYSAVSHLVGFLSLGIFGGVLADRLARADREIEEQRGDLANLRAVHWDIVESISTGLITTDLSGRVTFVNAAGKVILGRGEKIGRNVTTLFGLPRDMLSQVEDHLKTGKRFRFERPWTRPDDDEGLLLGFSVSPLRDRSGNPFGWLIVYQDLTEIASLEEQVRTRERMAALGEMAAGMAHELRNPLAAITGCIQVLQGREAEIDAPDESGRLEEVVLRESERLNRIIRDFLEFARPGALRRRPTDLAQLMRDLAPILLKSPEVGCDHRVEVVPGPGRTIAQADPDGMRQVFWNLASNAIKAMPQGGLLRIRVCSHGGDRVLVEFQDDGQGMDPETARRYFQPFHGRFEQGTGLGAAIVYRIVEEHGGQIQVVSREGHGTAIRVILPCAETLDVGDRAGHGRLARAVAE